MSSIDRSRSQLEEDLYLTSDEEAASKPSSSKKKDAVSTSHQQRSSKKKLAIRPITKPARVSAKDLFGEDSGDEQVPAQKVDTIPPLQSVFVNKLATGMSKQVHPKKSGAYYFDLKVYKCEEIEKVAPINRWRHSVASIKCKTDTDTELWQHLTNVVTASRKEFRGLPNVYSSFFSMQ